MSCKTDAPNGEDLASLEEGDVNNDDDALDLLVPKVTLTRRERLTQCAERYDTLLSFLIGFALLLITSGFIALMVFVLVHLFGSGVSSTAIG